MNLFEEIKHNFRHGSIITKLIIANFAVFAIQSIALLIFVIIGQKDTFIHFLTYLYFPNNLREFLEKPWTLFTYMFLHDPLSIFHILFNMAYLYFFGRILNDFLSRRNILPLYIISGIVGAFLFMITYNLSPAFQKDSILFGASASILGIMVAAATLVPDYTVMLMFIGAVRLKWITLIALLIDIVSISAGSNAGGHISHLGGALTGFLYIKSYQHGYNWFDWWYAFKNKISGIFTRKPKVAFKNPDIKYNTAKKSAADDGKQKRTDEILDKIAKSGYESLSREEKEYLFKISTDKE